MRSNGQILLQTSLAKAILKTAVMVIMMVMVMVTSIQILIQMYPAKAFEDIQDTNFDTIGFEEHLAVFHFLTLHWIYTKVESNIQMLLSSFLKFDLI